MCSPILVANANEKQNRELCAILERESYLARALYSPKDLKNKINESGCRVLLVDLDSLSFDDRFFRQLKREHPKLCIIVLSSRSFHPELRETMSSHIHASLLKPIEEDELIYWLKSICENDEDSKDPPDAKE